MEEDKDLLASFRQEGTRHYAFNLLVKKYQQRVYWHVRKMVIDHEDANDITQDVFVKVWDHLLNFRGDSSLFTWIYRIASNECLNFLSKKKRFFFLPILDIEKSLNSRFQVQDGLSGEDIQVKLQKALVKLPSKQRLIFNMKYFEDLSYDQISEILGTSVGALKASYHFAVKKIEKFLETD